MKIPDEYLSGSKPLDKNREMFALGLVNLSFQLAEITSKDPIFLQTLNLNTINDKDKNRITLELVLFNLSLTSFWIMKNYKHKPHEVLDRMYYHFRSAVSDNDIEFGQIVDERGLNYSKAVSTQAGAGPLWWLGKAVTENILGKEIDSRDAEDVEMAMNSIAYINQLTVVVTKSVKDYVNNTRGLKGLIKRILG